MSRFVHLHTHSHYSLLTALPKIPELVKAAKADEMVALALTDNGNLYGAIEFYKECKKAGINPIIGVDFYVATRTRHDKEANVDNRRYRLVLLAENNAGYQNLIKLVTESNLDGFYYKPRVDRELLEKYHEGLLAIIPSFSGETSGPLRVTDFEKAQDILSWHKKIFGENNVFLEITHHPDIENHEELNTHIKTLARDTKTPLVAAHDVYYMKPEDKRAREVVLSIQNGGAGGLSNDEEVGDFSFISQSEAESYFSDVPEALANTVSVASRCKVELELGTWTFPNLILPSGKTYEEELRELTYAGIEKRKLERTEEVVNRIEYELNIIKLKGFAPYFLVVADLLHYAHDHGILTTIRGSVAGSLVTYLSGITNINPLEYKLPFERFLNPERPV
jgi:DNA polymerase-3 subunit alpha